MFDLVGERPTGSMPDVLLVGCRRDLVSFLIPAAVDFRLLELRDEEGIRVLAPT